MNCIMLQRSSPKTFLDLLRKYKKKNCNSNTDLSANDLYEHFKSLFSDTNIFSDQNIENTINHESFVHVITS
jgi:hypothetical protein